MLAQRLLSAQLRSPILRRAFQQRIRGYATASPTTVSPGSGVKMAGRQVKLEGVADNAFNRERAAVKAHAQATSGEWASMTPSSLVEGLLICGADLWRRLSI